MSLKSDSIEAIKLLPNSATAADIQYQLYVVSKISRSESAVKKQGAVSHVDAAKKLKRWLIK
jgi:hypothetical protein